MAKWRPTRHKQPLQITGRSHFIAAVDQQYAVDDMFIINIYNKPVMVIYYVTSMANVYYNLEVIVIMPAQLRVLIIVSTPNR